MKKIIANILLFSFFIFAAATIGYVMLSCTFHFSEPTQHDYIIDSNSKTFHYYSCDKYGEIDERRVWSYFGTKEELINRGYSSCERCGT